MGRHETFLSNLFFSKWGFLTPLPLKDAMGNHEYLLVISPARLLAFSMDRSDYVMVCGSDLGREEEELQSKQPSHKGITVHRVVRRSQKVPFKSFGLLRVYCLPKTRSVPYCSLMT